MNLYHLRYFVTLAHLEHYTKAAEILGITQPSLSHAISSLEEELKVRLFEKDGRNIVLTKWGSIFLKDVEDTLNRLDSSVENLQMTGSGNGITVANKENNTADPGEDESAESDYSQKSSDKSDNEKSSSKTEKETKRSSSENKNTGYDSKEADNTDSSKDEEKTDRGFSLIYFHKQRYGYAFF